VSNAAAVLQRRLLRVMATLLALAGVVTMSLGGWLVWQNAASRWPAMVGAATIPGVVGVLSLVGARRVWRRSQQSST
jgi:thiosulfate reductase cytochrome b subunit